VIEKCNSCRYAEEKTASGWVPCDNPPLDVLINGSVEDCSMYEHADIAQERGPSKSEVVGSSPTVCSK
jgi:hypothetical protein